MKNIRIGNDIIIGWALYDVLGNPYQLKKEFKLSLKCGNYSLDITDYTVEDNKVTFMFYGKDQTVTGVYTLTLIENDDEVGMHTVDCCKVFRMVNTSCESNDYNAINPEVESLDLHSKIDYFPPVTIDKELSGTSENPVQNKVITSKITIIDEDITSINDDINNINNNVSQLDTELNKTIVNAIAQESKTTDEKIAKEKDALVNGDTIVGQAREIHSRNGKTVTDSFLVRTTAGSGTIGDGVASLKSVGGNIVKNLVGDFISRNDGRIDLTTKRGIYFASVIGEYNAGDTTLRLAINPTIAGHKYYFGMQAKSSKPLSAFLKQYDANNYLVIRQDVTEYAYISNIVTETKSRDSILLYLWGYSGTVAVGEQAVFSQPLLVDLTEMFGAGKEPDKATCDKLFGTMDALPQGLSIAKPSEFKSSGFNQFNPDNVLEGKAIANNAIVSGDKKIAVIPCLPCKVGVGENNGYCIHGEFGDDIKVYLTPLNPMEVDGELYMQELTKDATTDTYVPLIKGYMLVEVPTTANLCAHFLWSEDKCDRDSYEPYFESKIELPAIPQMSEWGLAGIHSSGTLVCDEIDLERGVYVKRINAVDLGNAVWGETSATSNGYKTTIANLEIQGHFHQSLICKNYTTGFQNTEGCIYATSNVVVVPLAKNKYPDVASFKAAMQGVYLYYELAEPEEYPLPKIDNNYISSDYGVEQFDSVVPCNANNLYYMRSLAGETRNFLDRLYHNTDKTDANEVADYITNAPNLALRALFVAAGAEYNDSGTDKTKTAPWGETVTHKAGHYYLNGLGDITEAQMLRIYNRGNLNDADIAPLSDSYSYANNIRTNLPRVGSWNGTLQPYLSRSNSRIEVITLHVARFSVAEICNINFANTESLFIGSSALSVIDTRCRLASSNWSGNSFKNCVSLKEVRIEKLKNNLVFAQSSQLSKASVLFAIEKATPTSAITITLHPDAYARLANDADIVAALTAQPLVTLVSA